MLSKKVIVYETMDGVYDPHTFLWQHRSHMVRRFLKAGEAEKERMIRMKIGSSTVIHTFAQLVRDDIINHHSLVTDATLHTYDHLH